MSLKLDEDSVVELGLNVEAVIRALDLLLILLPQEEEPELLETELDLELRPGRGTILLVLPWLLSAEPSPKSLLFLLLLLELPL